MDALSSAEILQYVAESGILDLQSVQQQIEMKKREYYLKQHKYSIWQGTNDRFWYTKILKDSGKPTLVKRKTERDLYDAIVKFYKEQELEPTLKQVYHQWIEEKLRDKEITKATKDRYDCDFEKFFSGTDFSNKKVKSITDTEIEDFIRKTIVDYNLTQKSYSGVRTLINGIFKFAKRKKYITYSITYIMNDIELSSRMFAKNIKDKKNQVYQEDEIPIMIEFLKSNPDIWNLGILFVFQTGLRIGELCAIKRSDKNGALLHIQRTEIKYKHDDGVTRREVRDFPKSEAGDRFVILTEKAQATYDRIIQINPNGEYLFENPTTHRRICSSSFDKRIGANCKKLGFNRKSMHKIRKTFGTILLDSNVDESLITDQMGHKDIETTRKYYYFSNKNEVTRIRQMNEAIGDIG